VEGKKEEEMEDKIEDDESNAMEERSNLEDSSSKREEDSSNQKSGPLGRAIQRKDIRKWLKKTTVVHKASRKSQAIGDGSRSTTTSIVPSRCKVQRVNGSSNYAIVEEEVVAHEDVVIHMDTNYVLQ